MRRIDTSCHKDIIEAYTVDLWPMRRIGEVLHVSHAAIFKILRKHGIDTTKHPLEVSCTSCGNTIQRTKKRVAKQLNHFCDQECYTSFLQAGAGDYAASRSGQRAARREAAKHFNLLPSHVVHHRDRNQFNNHPSNLMVFATQGDHIRYHHQMRHTYSNPITNARQARAERYHPPVTVLRLWEG